MVFLFCKIGILNLVIYDEFVNFFKNMAKGLDELP